MVCAEMVPEIHSVLALAGVEPEVWLRFAGRLHPLVVHFPIALLLVALLAESAGAIRNPTRRSRVAVACLFIGTFGAIVAAWFGWINAEQEPHGRAVLSMMEMHRVLGIATAIVASLASISVIVDRRRASVAALYCYRFALFLSVLLVSFGSHLGGQMVYGSEYLVEVFRGTDASEQLAGEQTTDALEKVAARGDYTPFTIDILPIFEAHCLECHGPRRQKAGLRLDQASRLFEGPREFWIVEPGNATESVLYQRIALPAGHIDLMPAGGDRLSDAEIQVIHDWIEGGSDAVPGDATPTDDTAGIENDGIDPNGPPFGLPPLADDKHAAQLEVLHRIRERGGAAAFVADGSPAVDINFGVVGSSLTGEDLALLEGLESTLVWLDLSGATLSDGDLDRLTSFPHLRRLHLNRTSIGDAGMAVLSQLRYLEYLNLYGTQVTDRGIAQLASLENLQRLYLWDTSVSEQAMVGLRKHLPKVEIVGETTLEIAIEAAEAESNSDASTAESAAGG